MQVDPIGMIVMIAISIFLGRISTLWYPVSPDPRNNPDTVQLRSRVTETINLMDRILIVYKKAVSMNGQPHEDDTQKNLIMSFESLAFVGHEALRILIMNSINKGDGSDTILLWEQSKKIIDMENEFKSIQ
jgi:hypothetical protein